MHVNIDDVISKTSNPPLDLTVGGKTHRIVHPSEEQVESLKKVGGLSPTSAEIKDTLAPLLCDLTGSPDPGAWTFIQLTGVAAAIIAHHVASEMSHLRAVMAAVRTGVGNE